MRWMKDRDLLIAQTMEFVQSVSAETLAAEKVAARERPVPTSAALPPVELSPAALKLVELPSIRRPEQKTSTTTSPGPMPDTGALLAVSGGVAEQRRPPPVPRTNLRDELQSEVKARIANFRAHQERFNREREAYCSAAMARLQAALEVGRSTRPGK
ncbi:hypothetical protein [Bradyrhizobium sp.]|uniref:hypothetical protein n=1 Tax=Bradyrhizobium sp. TaxID=376 RepID=UPI0025C1DABF|nr:hypothetical protein [Bradyrhizobium sp.]